MADEELVLLFDGVCNVCSGSVAFILKRDTEAKFKFAHLQSTYAQNILKKHNINQKDALASMVLLIDGKPYLKSTAALEIAKRLPMPYPMLAGGYIMPQFIRDKLYDCFGNHRYQLFGKKDECWLPDDPDWKKRFIA